MIYCLQFVKFDSSASFIIVPRLENVSRYSPALFLENEKEKHQFDRAML